jgi:hypothetical protein
MIAIDHSEYLCKWCENYGRCRVCGRGFEDSCGLDQSDAATSHIREQRDDSENN